MKLFTASQMRALDKAAIERHGVPSIDLMERAGQGVTKIIRRHFPKKGRVAIVVGKGNNAGDGLVVARGLAEEGYQISLFLLSPWTEFSQDARINWDRLATLKVDAYELASDTDIKKHNKIFESSLCIVDAIFGTGLSQDVTGRYKHAIEFINGLAKPVVAVDVPSGLSADTGQPLGVAIRARITATLAAPKVGLFTSTGSEYAKDVEVVDIGMPQELLESAQTGYTLVTSDVISHLFAERKKDSHKGDFGHVIVAGGSAGKMGAGLLACRAVLRSGAGLVTYALPDTAFAKFDTKSPEIMYEPLADKGKGFLTKDSAPQLKQLLAGKTAMVLGPGIGTQGETKTVVHDVLAKAVCPIVLDADGLNCVADKPSVISGRKVPIVITPHPGEMSRLTGEPTAKIQTSRMDTARQFAKAHGIIVVLKGFRSVIALPSGEIFINPTGGPAMATAGMGDVLSGVIAGFISQKIPVDMAVVAGVYIHGLAGDLSAKKVGERGLIASDVIANIPEAIKNIYEGGNKKSK